MSGLQKFKAYFGMVPMEEYEDDYIDDLDGREDSYDRGARGAGYRSGPRGGYEEDYDDYDEPAYRGRPRVTSMPTTRGALAVDPHREVRAESAPRPRASLFDESGGMSKITTLRPREYSEARTIGERFRDGTPVIMDLVEMSNADAKRLVDFAAGLAFALRGSFDKVATKVFLLSPAEVDVTAEDRRRIAETGFYGQ